MTPWIVGQQFQDTTFPRLSGGRVVRVAVHPDLMRAGYGSRAVQAVVEYFEGQLAGRLLGLGRVWGAFERNL